MLIYVCEIGINVLLQTIIIWVALNGWAQVIIDTNYKR
jgi:hypothetical protein